MNSAQIRGARVADILELIRRIPENWWGRTYNELQRLLLALRSGRLQDLAASEIGRWANKQRVLRLSTVEGRILTLNIPYGDGKNYQITVVPTDAEKVHNLSIFHPGPGAELWYARMALWAALEGQHVGITVEGRAMSGRAWLATCAAWGTPAAGLIADMSEDGLI